MLVGMPRLRPILALALLTAAASCGWSTEPTEPPPAVTTAAAPKPLPGRGLTEGERALLRPWFGAAIDYDAVRILPRKFIAFQPSGVYMTHAARIFAPGRLFKADFADPAVSDHLRAVFIHEVVHAWQYQNGMNVMAAGLRDFIKGGGDYRDAYEYTLVAGRDLTDYGM